MLNRNKILKVMIADELSLAVQGVSLSDRISVPTKRTMTDGGQMHVPCAFARTGSQLYSAKQLGLKDCKPSDVITVWRDEADVFATDSMDSFRSAPVTIGHPKNAAGLPMAVTADNSKELQVGMLEGMPTRDEDTLGGVLVLTSKEAIDALEDGTQELSAGYLCDIELLDGKYFQRNIRANHIAIVNQGRAGSSCRISDEADLLRLADDHPEPMRWDFTNDEAYDNAMKCWHLVEANEYSKSSDAEGKAAGNTGSISDEAVFDEKQLAVGTKHEMEHTTDESEAAKIAKDHLLEDPEYYVKLAKAGIDDELETQKQLVLDFKLAAEESDVATEKLKVQLADALLAAEEGVVERCAAIENARLIADMRDLTSKSCLEIYRMVVEDQMPDKDLAGKSDSYVEAMFEILVDASKGETPMGKLLKNQNLADTTNVVVAKPVDPVLEARKRSIARNSGK